MTGYRLLLCSRIVASQALHFLAPPLRHRRVVPYQVTCYDGFLRPTSFLLAAAAQTGMFCQYLGSHFLPEVTLPLPRQILCLPGGLSHETACSREADPTVNLLQQTRQGLSALAQHQPQKYGHKILVLRVTEAVGKLRQKLAQPWVKTYYWQPHSSPLVKDSFGGPSCTSRWAVRPLFHWKGAFLPECRYVNEKCKLRGKSVTLFLDENVQTEAVSIHFDDITLYSE